MLFTGLGRSVFGETVPSEYRPRPTVSGGTQDLGHSFSQYGPPSQCITYIYICVMEIQEIQMVVLISSQDLLYLRN